MVFIAACLDQSDTSPRTWDQAGWQADIHYKFLPNGLLIRHTLPKQIQAIYTPS